MSLKELGFCKTTTAAHKDERGSYFSLNQLMYNSTAQKLHGVLLVYLCRFAHSRHREWQQTRGGTHTKKKNDKTATARERKRKTKYSRDPLIL